eukprot:CAMPEP_0117879004 /NCGR_PEP_ID=MMETSP0950-20121206/15219_1 /TAXON_ID=44440 /ORGANISM="Chattonella subsalsa, Strain CCMP2191" /LENGTH=369 /DNA_ID=CAMNT_0005733483 /DNA_START=32 /DNA_END=1142 /DNA_ORIENTATION=+
MQVDEWLDMFLPVAGGCLLLSNPNMANNKQQWDDDLDPYETRMVPVNTYLSTGVMIKDPSEKISTYLFAGAPPLDQVLNSQFSYSDLKIQPNGYKAYSYYLNPGSSASIQFSSQSGIYLLIIKGDAMMKTFSNNAAKADPESSSYSSNGYEMTQSFSVNFSPDDYYFVLYNTNNFQKADASIDISLQRTLYDLHGAQQTCTATMYCKMFLSHGSSEVVVLDAPDAAAQDEFLIHYSSYTNWPMYFKIFGGLFMILVFSWVVCEGLVRWMGVFKFRQPQMAPAIQYRPNYPHSSLTPIPEDSSGKLSQLSDLNRADHVSNSGYQSLSQSHGLSSGYGQGAKGVVHYTPLAPNAPVVVTAKQNERQLRPTV